MPETQSATPRPSRALPISLALLVAALAQALLNRFIQDDAFISFVYAKNLVAGEGLTWFGTHVEGYTNFLWVLLMSVGIGLDFDAITFSYALGITCFLITVHSQSAIAQRIDTAPHLFIVAPLLLIGNYSVAAYATGGLETMLQTCLGCLGLRLLVIDRALEQPSRRNAMWFSLLTGLALLTRLDSAVLFVIPFALWLVHLIARRASPIVFVSLFVPATLLVGSWLGWKLSYYGDILPNTYYAKLGESSVSTTTGLLYIGRFLHWYLLWPFLVLGGVTLVLKRIRVPFAIVVSASVVAMWSLYIVYTGGDFMEFRFMIPIAPCVYLLLGYSLHAVGHHLIGRPILYTALAASILLGFSWHHARSFKSVSADRSLDSIHMLSTLYGACPDGDWQRLGKGLAAEIGHAKPRIALHAAGAIPYYSGLDTVDMWGLNDPVIPFHGSPSPKDYARPGHRRHATLTYLRERKVNFVIGHPTVVAAELLGRPGTQDFMKQRWLPQLIVSNREPMRNSKIVAIPIGDQRSLIALYLTPTQKLDELIARRGWRRIVIP